MLSRLAAAQSHTTAMAVAVALESVAPLASAATRRRRCTTPNKTKLQQTAAVSAICSFGASATAPSTLAATPITRAPAQPNVEFTASIPL